MKPKLRLLLVSVAAAAMGALSLRAQVLTVLHNFEFSTGGEPYGGLVLSGGTLIGTTSGGGTNDNGIIFAVSTDGTVSNTLHDFIFNEGSFLRSGLVLSGSTLFGPAYGGGTGNVGTIFSLDTSGNNFTNLYTFANGVDGGDPRGALTLSGNILYGTAQTGGSGNGTLYSLQTNGSNFTTVFAFDGTNGSQPYGNLVLSGNVLYGTTDRGGSSNYGTIYSVQTNGSNFTVLHNFTNSDGAYPTAGLVLAGGTLYGTTSSGGSNGSGAIFSIPTNGGNLTLLHSFTGPPADGSSPDATLILSGNLLYGTTGGGGSGNGTIFSIPTNGGNLTSLYSFTGGSDGGDPEGPLLLAGNFLYGATVSGGDSDNGSLFSLQIASVEIMGQPLSQINVSPGEDIAFGTVAQSPAAAVLQYQWRRNGVNIPGATLSALALDNVQATDGGNLTTALSDGTDAPNSAIATLTVSATSAGENDDFTNRFDLGTTAAGLVRSDNTGATLESGEPAIYPGNPGGKSIWFKWKAPSTGTVVFTTQGSCFDTIIGVFDGTSIPTLTREPSAVGDDDSGGYLTSKVTFNCASGVEYEIGVDGYRGAFGPVVLSWNATQSSSQLPIIVSSPPAQTVTSNGAALTLQCDAANAGTISWLFNGQPTLITGPTFVINPVNDSTIGAYVAQVDSASGAGAVLTQPAHVQTTVDEDGTTDTNSLALNKFLDSAGAAFSPPPPSPSHRPFDGGDTRGFTIAQTFSTVGAAGEPAEPNIAGQIGGSPVWYAYITPTNGSLVINTDGSSFNTLLGVFIGPGNSYATLTNIGSGYTTNRAVNGQPQVYIPNAPKGQTNFIVVDGYHGASGVVHLNIKLGAPVAITTPPASQFALIGSNATFLVGASGSTPLSYFWLFNGTNIPGATNGSLTISNVGAADFGPYTVMVSNLVSVLSNSATLTLGMVPVISTQPLSHTVPSNTTAGLSVVAAGIPALAYQWFFNGSNAGSNSASLSIPNFQSTNQGTYSLVASNSVGSTASSNAFLLLDSPLRVSLPSLNGGVFQLQLIGASGGNYVLQASTNLVDWTALLTNNATNGFLNLTDTNTDSFPHRFYRGATN